MKTESGYTSPPSSDFTITPSGDHDGGGGQVSELTRKSISIPAPCNASREAVEEREEFGEIGCPLCGRSAEAHKSEDDRA